MLLPLKYSHHLHLYLHHDKSDNYSACKSDAIFQFLSPHDNVDRAENQTILQTFLPFSELMQVSDTTSLIRPSHSRELLLKHVYLHQNPINLMRLHHKGRVRKGSLNQFPRQNLPMKLQSFIKM